ncbi:MAG: hypothetical protein NXI04_13895 [Planctomycetaceae bacterium]|nr:hypothetical protein [Planctomycetaceae bacterium]
MTDANPFQPPGLSQPLPETNTAGERVFGPELTSGLRLYRVAIVCLIAVQLLATVIVTAMLLLPISAGPELLRTLLQSYLAMLITAILQFGVAVRLNTVKELSRGLRYTLLTLTILHLCTMLVPSLKDLPGMQIRRIVPFQTLVPLIGVLLCLTIHRDRKTLLLTAAVACGFAQPEIQRLVFAALGATVFTVPTVPTMNTPLVVDFWLSTTLTVMR